MRTFRQLIPSRLLRPIAVGGIIALVTIIAAVLLLSGRSEPAQAREASVMQNPLQGQQTVTLPPVARLGSAFLSRMPDEILDELPMEGFSSNDGIPLSGPSGLLKKDGVMLTPDLAAFSQSLSSFFAAHGMQAKITSGVRSQDRQLQLIKQRILEHGASNLFPRLSTATIADKDIWMPAWEWLKSAHVPIDPPSSYVDEDGDEVQASLHTKGMALDIVSDDLDALKSALSLFSRSQAANLPVLHIESLTRERNCVHIALSK